MAREPNGGKARPTLSAVMPVFDGRHYLVRSLPPLAAALGRDLLELLVIDDGSSDGSAELARSIGARVLESGGRLGPGAARNVGAQAALGDVLLFVDADVVMHADVPARVRDAFYASEGRDLVALFGSYDDDPPDRAFASQYMNLRHHFVHQRAPGDAATFWAGLGAVRRDAFLAVGGFDVARYARPSIEDIELGYRLRDAGGRIALDSAMQGTHLKRWRWRDVWHTDITCRALPWSRLLATRPPADAALNATPVERMRAIVAGLLALSVLAAVIRVVPAWLPLLAFAAAVLANARLAAFFARRRGPLFAGVAMAWHQLYYLYAGTCFAVASLERRRGRASAP